MINALTGQVTLDGSASSDFEGGITNYAWSWTGGSASGVNPTVTLPGSLTYVTLAVTDTGGANTEFTFLLVFPSPLEIAQQAYLKASNSGSGDQFGYAVAISGDTVVVGAPYEQSRTTGVGSLANNEAANAGAVYVFVRSGETWCEQAYLKASNAQAGDWFGWSVGIWGDTLVVGAIGEDSNATGVNGDGSNNSASNSGTAYVFVRNVGLWSEQAYLKAFNADFSDSFGYSVAVSGERVLVGAYREGSSALGVANTPDLESTLDNSATNAGAAYVFIRNGNDWMPQSYLKASNTGANEYYGYAVALSGDTLAIGANQEKSSTKGVNSAPDKLASNAGAAYIAGFRPLGANLASIARADYEILDTGSGLVALDASASVDPDGTIVSYDWSWFGGSASGMTASATLPPAETSITLIVTDDVGGTHEKVFPVNLPTPLEIAQQAYLKPYNTGSGDNFGHAVAVSGTVIVVGAVFEDSASTGVNSEPDEAATNAGAAYIFTDPDIPSPNLADFAATAGLTGDDALPNAMPFNDGVENLLKFAFNMNLAGPDSHSMTPGGSSGLPGGGLVEEAGQTYWRVEYVRRKGSGLIYTPQKSGNLGEGSFTALTGEETVSEISGDPDWERDIIDEPCDPASEDRCFSRVRVDLP